MPSSQPISRQGRAYAALFFGILAMVLSPLFIRWSAAPGLVTAFYKMFIAPLILTPLVIYTRRSKIAPFILSLRCALSGRPESRNTAQWPNLKIFLFPLAAGFFSAMDHGLWALALGMTSVANTTLLNNLSPVWVGLFAVVVWREKLKSRFWLGLAVALVGTGMVLGSSLFSGGLSGGGALSSSRSLPSGGPLSSGEPLPIGGSLSSGDLLAILSSMFYGGFFLISRKGRQVLSVLVYLWSFSAAGAACLFVAVRLAGLRLTGYSLQTNLIFLATALVVQLAAYACITYALGILPASIVSPTMVLQPVLTALVAIPFTGEGLSIAQVVGGLLTLGGIWVVNKAGGSG